MQHKFYAPDWGYAYGHLLPQKSGVTPIEGEITKQCLRCGVDIVTRSRVRKRCDSCQLLVEANQRLAANERLKKKRAAKKKDASSRTYEPRPRVPGWRQVKDS